MPSSRYATRPRHKALTAEAVRGESFRRHKSHDSSEHPIGRQHNAEGNIVMVSAGKNERAYREHSAAPREPTPQSTVTSLIVPPVMHLSTAFGFASALPTTLSDTPSLLPTLGSKTSEQKELLSESLASAHATTSLVSTSASAPRSRAFPHALLAFTLIFVCLFCVMMLLALRRMFCHKKVGIRLVVPPDTTASESNRKIDEAMGLKKQTRVDSDAIVEFDQSRPGNLVKHRTDSLECTRQTAQRGASFDMRTNTIHSPLPAHVIGSVQSTRSRVLHPYVPRSYDHPYLAYNGEAEAVFPLAAAKGFENADNHNTRGKIKGPQRKTRTKNREKENVQDTASNHSRRHRNSRLARSMDRPCSVSIVHETVAPSATLNSMCDDPMSEVFSSSVQNMKGDDNSVPESGVDPRLPTASTIAVDIGLAMLAEFSSPEIGPKFDSQSRSGSPLALEHLENHPARPGSFPPPSNAIDSCESGVFPHVVRSNSSESGGLAYLASSSSPSLTERSTEEGLKSDRGLDARAQAHARLVEQLNLAIDDPDAPAPAPAAVSFKAPLLPTLSEMALSRTDPLYESVTNELFASYGFRMSTASGTERTSRVSARISRMLSWVEDAASSESTATGERTCDGLGREWLSERRDTHGIVTEDGGVQPLRVNGRLLCKSSA